MDLKVKKLCVVFLLMLFSLTACSDRADSAFDNSGDAADEPLAVVSTPVPEENNLREQDVKELPEEQTQETTVVSESNKTVKNTPEPKKTAETKPTSTPEPTPVPTPEPTPEETPVPAPTSTPESTPVPTPEVQTASPTDVPKSATVGGVTVSLNADMAGVLGNLGEPSSYDEQDSCYYSGKDKTYSYNEFEITTYPSGETDKVASIYFKKGSISGSAQIGSSRSDVLAKHAGDTIRETSTAITFVKGGRGITYYMSGDTVSAIELYLDN